MKILVLLLVALALTAGATRAFARTDTLTVVTLNLWHDQQNWPARRALIIEEMRGLKPDVIFLQEVLQHATLKNQAQDLAEELGYRYVFSSVDADTSVKRYGNAILSRFAMLTTDWKPLLPLNDYRTVAHLRMDMLGRPVDLFCTHLHHTDEGAAIRAEQIADLLVYVQKHRLKGAPLILGGDFNAAPSVSELAPVKKEFIDVFAAKQGAASDTITTLNPAKGHKPRRIDYIFIPRRGKPKMTPLSSERVFDVPSADGTWPSDHFGIVARIRIAN